MDTLMTDMMVTLGRMKKTKGKFEKLYVRSDARKWLFGLKYNRKKGMLMVCGPAKYGVIMERMLELAWGIEYKDLEQSFTSASRVTYWFKGRLTDEDWLRGLIKLTTEVYEGDVYVYKTNSFRRTCR